MDATKIDRFAAVVVDFDPRRRRSPSRRRVALVHLAAAFILLAPLACQKEESPEEPVVVEQPIADQTASEETEQAEMETGEGGPQEPPSAKKDRDLAPLMETLNGSWSNSRDDGCTQLDFDLEPSMFSNYSTAVFYRSPGQGMKLRDLYRHPWAGLGGVTESGGPYGDCGDPNTMRFFASAVSPDSIHVSWRCASEDGGVVRDDDEYYYRGACPGATSLNPPGAPIAEPLPEVGTGSPPAGGTETQSETGPGGTTGHPETVVDEIVSNTGACAIAGAWRQSTVDVGATTWEITASGQATETGIGYAKGTATLTGRTLRIDWTTTNGYAGSYQWTLDSDCKSGSGTLVFSAGRTGSFSSIVTR